MILVINDNLLSTATPDVSTYTYDESSGYYYDSSTGLYYDANSTYYYNSETCQYLYWDSEKCTYLPAPTSDDSQDSAFKDKKKEEKTDKVKVKWMLMGEFFWF